MSTKLIAINVFWPASAECGVTAYCDFCDTPKLPCAVVELKRKDDMWICSQCLKQIQEMFIDKSEAQATGTVIIKHGVSCRKKDHKGKSDWLHDALDDKPYDVDGVMYCGRCHAAL